MSEKGPPLAIFATGAPTQTAAVLSSATLIFDTQASGIPSGAALPNITVENTGTKDFFLGSASVTAATGLLLKAGQQILILGNSANQASTAGDIYGITASGSSTSLSGLATNANIA